MQLSAAITSLSFIRKTTDPGENKENIQYISDWSGLSGFKQSGFKHHCEAELQQLSLRHLTREVHIQLATTV